MSPAPSPELSSKGWMLLSRLPSRKSTVRLVSPLSALRLLIEFRLRPRTVRLVSALTALISTS